MRNDYESECRNAVGRYIATGTRFIDTQIDITSLVIGTTTVHSTVRYRLSAHISERVLAGLHQSDEPDWQARSYDEYVELGARQRSECEGTQDDFRLLLKTVQERPYVAVSLHQQTLIHHPNDLHYIKQCSACDGSGTTTCYSCGGRGKKTCTSCGGTGSRTQYCVRFNPATGRSEGSNEYVSCGCSGGQVTCLSCAGSGCHTCPSCSGTGKQTLVSHGETRIEIEPALDFATRSPLNWIADYVNPLLGQASLLDLGDVELHESRIDLETARVIASDLIVIPYATVTVSLNGKAFELCLVGKIPKVILAAGLFEGVLMTDLEVLEQAVKRQGRLRPFFRYGISRPLRVFSESEVNRDVIKRLNVGQSPSEVSQALQQALSADYVHRVADVLVKVTSRSAVKARLNAVIGTSMMTLFLSAGVAILIAKGVEHRLPFDATFIDIFGTASVDLVLIGCAGLFAAVVVTGLVSWFHRDWLYAKGTESLLTLAKRKKQVVGKWTAIVAFFAACTSSWALFDAYPLRAGIDGELFGISGVIPAERISILSAPTAVSKMKAVKKPQRGKVAR